LNAAVRNPPALVLLDISMPAGSGFSIAEQIQTRIPTPIPIIFLTASKQPDFREKAEKLGAAGYFEKPYEAEELFGAIRQVLA
jgi:CheY-like chemotaxis protein